MNSPAPVPPLQGCATSRRAVIASVALLPSLAWAAPRTQPPNASAIRWTGAGGRTLHGYMAIPARARGRQAAVLVIGDAAALPPAADGAARAVVDALAAAGLIGCTADNVSNEPDLAASLAWLRFNRLSTGRVAIVALPGGAIAAGRLVAAEPASVAALVLLGAPSLPSSVPTLSLPWNGATSLPLEAIGFLKEHLA